MPHYPQPMTGLWNPPHPRVFPPHYHYHHVITTLSLAACNCGGACVVFLYSSLCCAFKYFLWGFDNLGSRFRCAAAVWNRHYVHFTKYIWCTVCCFSGGENNLWAISKNICLNRSQPTWVFLLSSSILLVLVQMCSSDQPGFFSLSLFLSFWPPTSFSSSLLF